MNPITKSLIALLICVVLTVLCIVIIGDYPKGAEMPLVIIMYSFYLTPIICTIFFVINIINNLKWAKNHKIGITIFATFLISWIIYVIYYLQSILMWKPVERNMSYRWAVICNAALKHSWICNSADSNKPDVKARLFTFYWGCTIRVPDFSGRYPLVWVLPETYLFSYLFHRVQEPQPFFLHGIVIKLVRTLRPFKDKPVLFQNMDKIFWA